MFQAARNLLSSFRRQGPLVRSMAQQSKALSLPLVKRSRITSVAFWGSGLILAASPFVAKASNDGSITKPEKSVASPTEVECFIIQKLLLDVTVAKEGGDLDVFDHALNKLTRALDNFTLVPCSLYMRACFTLGSLFAEQVDLRSAHKYINRGLDNLAEHPHTDEEIHKLSPYLHHAMMTLMFNEDKSLKQDVAFIPATVDRVLSVNPGNETLLGLSIMLLACSLNVAGETDQIIQRICQFVHESPRKLHWKSIARKELKALEAPKDMHDYVIKAIAAMEASQYQKPPSQSWISDHKMGLAVVMGSAVLGAAAFGLWAVHQKKE